jgi:hypothetical protein
VEIQYVENKNIDKRKWDQCINKAPNGLIYPYSWYLDEMAETWDAVIYGHYNAVMPLPYRVKYSIHYLYQPFLSAQLGVFGEFDQHIIVAMLNSIPAKFKYWDISLNQDNVLTIGSFQTFLRSNFVLRLSKSHEQISNGYSENLRRNIRKAVSSGCTLAKSNDEENLVTLALDQMKQHSPGSTRHVQKFRRVFKLLSSQNKAIVYEVKSQSGNLISSAAFFFSHNRAYYILVGNHPESKITGASHFLIDGFIKDHAGKELYLDFEGSDITSLANFYRSFGSKDEKYPAIHLNRLPWFLRLFKK